MSRVLLLNPPGRKNYIRDYFCSKVSKAAYISPPVTLLMLSGRLAREHDLTVLDAAVEHLSPEKVLRRAVAARPEAVVALTGAVCWDEDRAFFSRLKAATGATLIAIGDIFLEDAEARLAEAPAIDAALLNFVTEDILALIPKIPARAVPNTVCRRAGHGVLAGPRTPVRGDYSLPAPRHDLFPLRRYRFPFAVAHPMSAVLTDYGCPYRCTFCVIPGLGFAVRPLEGVMAELVFLKALGVREIFFIDQTFGARRDRTLALCRAMRGEELGLHWSCFSRADVTPPDVLAAMAAAGCHTIIYGVESGSEETLDRYHKRMRLADIEKTLKACRRAGIRTAATFLLGLPGESEAQARATVAAALRLPLDFAAFNVAVPRAGTPLRAESIAEGLISRDLRTMDQSGLAGGAIGTAALPAEKILALHRSAVMRFYLRPSYWLRRLMTLRSWHDFVTQAADGLELLRSVLFGAE